MPLKDVALLVELLGDDSVLCFDRLSQLAIQRNINVLDILDRCLKYDPLFAPGSRPLEWHGIDIGRTDIERFQFLVIL